MIVVLGREDDEHAVHVLEAVRERGEETELLDSRWFPGRVGISWEIGSGRRDLVFPSGKRVRWDGVKSVYWRSYDGVMPPAEVEDRAEVAYHDSRSLWESFLLGCPARWVNGWEGYEVHRRKPLALEKVAGMALPEGLRVPRTWVGNVPGDALGIGGSGGMVFKPVQGGAHTRRVTEAHLSEENLGRLRLSPVTFQEEVEGTDVRVFVAGERVMACEVRSGCLDFRDDADPEIVEVGLPGTVSDGCRRIAGELGLVWAGIDLRRTERGEYFYFEANPSPMFLGFERRCGLPLAAALVDLLVE